jgi:integrase
MRAVLRRALNHAIRWEIVARNVATMVDAPTRESHTVQPFDAEEAAAFLAAIGGHRLEALYCAVLACGLRQGEALGLRWDDVDLNARTLAVRKQLQYAKGSGFCLVDLKTARSHRTIHLPNVAALQLAEHKRRQAVERLPVGVTWNDWNLVFTSKGGRPLWASNVTHEFQRVLKRAGLRHQRFHDLRHACASLLLAQGVPARVVMEVLGHSQISVTLNTYSHVVPALQREAADRMDDVLG